MPVVVSRLINARRHWLALQISSVLGVGPEKVGAPAFLLRYAEGSMEGNALPRCMHGMWWHRNCASGMQADAQF